MIHARRDETGILARLECDLCGGKSIVFLVGSLKLWQPGAIERFRAWLRDLCKGTGWEQSPRIDGGPLIIDICGRCVRKARRTAKRRRTG